MDQAFGDPAAGDMATPTDAVDPIGAALDNADAQSVASGTPTGGTVDPAATTSTETTTEEVAVTDEDDSSSTLGG